MSNLVSMVRSECANFKGSTCLFGKCSVLNDKRCCVSRAVLLGGNPHAIDSDYFGACVAPMARNFPQYADAAVDYARICGRGKSAAAGVRRCECGEPMEKNKQHCAVCRLKRRREAIRQRVNRHRAACNAKLRNLPL